jgi:C-terminal of Roc, COR, domain
MIRKDHKSVSDEGFRYWLELIDVFGGHSPVLIFQNEKGGRSKAIDLGGIKGRYDNVKELYTGNLKRRDSADRLRAGIEFFASSLTHIGEELPARWIRVRADIEIRAREAPHISQQEYFQIYGRHLEFDRSKALHLSRYLHDIGVFLHFQDDSLLSRTIILQNEWATEAVFRILDDEIVKAQFGRSQAGPDLWSQRWMSHEVGYDRFRAFNIASAQRYASVATLSCATSSASLSGRVAKAVEPWTWLNNAVRAAAANLSRSSSSCSLAVVFTSTV